jgi:hypothetical protein
MKKIITFKELHRLVSEIDYINDESYPVSFTVDGIKYRAGIGPYCLDDLTNVAEDCNEEDKEHYSYFRDFFYGYDDEVQYLSRIEDEEIQEEYVLDVQDPDDMAFDEIGKMLKKCCSITETSNIQLHTNSSFNGNQYGVWWMELSDDVIEKEKECVKQWKSEIENEA